VHLCGRWNTETFSGGERTAGWSNEIGHQSGEKESSLFPRRLMVRPVSMWVQLGIQLQFVTNNSLNTHSNQSVWLPRCELLIIFNLFVAPIIVPGPG